MVQELILRPPIFDHSLALAGFSIVQTGLFFFGAGGCSNSELDRALVFPDSIDVTIINYCPEGAFSPNGAFAINHSLLLSGTEFEEDHDRDGLSDRLESEEGNRERYNISAGAFDTNQDGYSDMIVYALGIEPDHQDALNYCVELAQDADRDGLDDCDESLVGTSPTNPDEDLDGIPDGLEVRYGLNPFDSTDGRLDVDHDGLSMLEEVRYGTPLRYHNTFQIDEYRIRYDTTTYPGENDSECYSLFIERIPLSQVTNGNLIRFYFLEHGIVEEQGEVATLRTVSLVVPRTVSSGSRFEIDGVNGQTEQRGFDQ